MCVCVCVCVCACVCVCVSTSFASLKNLPCGVYIAVVLPALIDYERKDSAFRQASFPPPSPIQRLGRPCLIDYLNDVG